MTDGTDSAFGPGAIAAPWLGRVGVAPTAIDTTAAQARYAARAGWAQRRIAAALLPARRWRPGGADHAGGDLPLARLPVVGAMPVEPDDLAAPAWTDAGVAAGRWSAGIAQTTAVPGLAATPVGGAAPAGAVASGPGPASRSVPQMVRRLQRRGERPGLIDAHGPLRAIADLAAVAAGSSIVQRLAARATAGPILTGPMATGAPVLAVRPAAPAASTAAALSPATAPGEPPAPISSPATPATRDLPVGQAHRPPCAPAARSTARIQRQPDGARTDQPGPSAATTLASAGSMLSAARPAPSLSGMNAAPLLQRRWSARDETRPDRRLARTPVDADRPVVQRRGLPSQPGHPSGAGTGVAAGADGLGPLKWSESRQDRDRDTAPTATAPAARTSSEPDRTLARTPDLDADRPVVQRPGLPSQPSHPSGAQTGVAAGADGLGSPDWSESRQDRDRDTGSTAAAPAAWTSGERAGIGPPARAIDSGHDPEKARVGPSMAVPRGPGMVLARATPAGVHGPVPGAFPEGGVGPVRILLAGQVEPRPVGITGVIGRELPVSAGMVLRRVTAGGESGPGLVRSAAGGAAGAVIGPASSKALPPWSSRSLPMDKDLDGAGERICEPVAPGSGLGTSPAAKGGRGVPASAPARATSAATTASPVLIWRTAATGAAWTGAGGAGDLPPGFRAGLGTAGPATPAGAGDPVARTMSNIAQGMLVARRTDAGASAAAAASSTAPPPVPTEVAPVAAALPDPETLAEQVARILARRFEIERERRGGGVPWR